MHRSLTHSWCFILMVLLLATGCGSRDEVLREEVTIEDLNAALTYLKEAGRDYPQSVYELTNLPGLQGKIFPTLPEGQYFSIDEDNDQVIVEMNHLPEVKDSFPHKDSF